MELLQAELMLEIHQYATEIEYIAYVVPQFKMDKASIILLFENEDIDHVFFNENRDKFVKRYKG